jgi:hypothetical protein
MNLIKTFVIAAAIAAPAVAHAQTAPAAPAGPPQWTLKEATDAAGKPSATASIRAADGSGRLIVRCDTVAMPIVSIQYIPRPALPAMESHQVTVTFDESRAEFSAWEFPGSGAYRGEPFDVWIMVSGIATSKTIRIQTEDANATQIQSVFTGPGSDAMFRKVYAACGFPYQQPAVGLTQ